MKFLILFSGLVLALVLMMVNVAEGQPRRNKTGRNRGNAVTENNDDISAITAGLHDVSLDQDTASGSSTTAAGLHDVSLDQDTASGSSSVIEGPSTSGASGSGSSSRRNQRNSRNQRPTSSVSSLGEQVRHRFNQQYQQRAEARRQQFEADFRNATGQDREDYIDRLASCWQDLPPEIRNLGRRIFGLDKNGQRK
ncbi:uncharacterized protein LOC116350856 [Contarinia nasturtii]|uniref:uncharacterized protein LOC116350856 n=1 Tax=Contarinia nasturtii TaxID=265458 RepID=UPI0012D3CEDF|nr:uncharacterized protein LOC116350856 [Contarinia nasturtii]